MSTDNETSTDIKRQKGAFWSRPGAGAVYESGVSSRAGIIQIKNRVERAIVARHAHGRILDAGTGTGRFAIPMSAVPGNEVVAMDFSGEMLAQASRLSTQSGSDAIRFVQGDVERLPFASNAFDTVVSITVVRHFPQWKAILQEYARVVKPGGKLVFEMCSADHIRLANRIWPRFGVAHSDGGFASFEAEVAQQDLVAWLDSIGVDVEERLTYDFFNSNCFLKMLAINGLGYRVLNKAINVVFSLRPLAATAAWLELHVLRHLSPSISYNYMVVARKR